MRVNSSKTTMIYHYKIFMLKPFKNEERGQDSLPRIEIKIILLSSSRRTDQLSL